MVRELSVGKMLLVIVQHEKASTRGFFWGEITM